MNSPAALTEKGRAQADPLFVDQLTRSISTVSSWMKQRQYSGYDPFDLLNSPLFAARWPRRVPFSVAIRLFGSRLAGTTLRQLLRVQPGVNTKALGLALAGYCDLAQCSRLSNQEPFFLKSRLREMRSPGEQYFCWGYNFDSVALRSTTLAAGKPNIIATLFCANALLDMAEVFGDGEAEAMGQSVGKFIDHRLNRYIACEGEICFSYSPEDRTHVYNTSALTGAFLARLAHRTTNSEYFDLSTAAIRYILSTQRADGSWFYGDRRRQRWIDSFHTGYILTALDAYRTFTGDPFVSNAISSGYGYFKRHFLRNDGAVAYYHNSLYPIDIHACAQAIITLCDLRGEDAGALPLAVNVAQWTLAKMQHSDGHFAYQRHRLWTNNTGYMRWGQAWMFRAMTYLLKGLSRPAT
jgi:hypothetical protein